MKIIKKTSFLNSILTLISGAIIAQIITFAAAPIMTRLYSSEDIGLYTLIISFVTTFGAVICGRYEMLIITAKSEFEIYTLIKLSTWLLIIVSVIASILFSIYFVITNDTLDNILLYSSFVFILLVLTGLSNILISYNNRNKEYGLISRVQVIRTLTKESFMIIMGILWSNGISILLSQIIGIAVGLRKQAEKLKGNFKNILKVANTDIVKSAKKNYRQPLYSVPAIFVNNLSYASLNFIIGFTFGLSTLGFYALAFRILGMPINIIGNNVSRVYFEKANNEYIKKKKYKKTFLMTSLLLFTFSIPMVMGLVYLSPLVFGLLFGDEWKVAGEYISILAPLFGIRFIVSALSTGMIISNKQNAEFIINILFLVASITVTIFTLNMDFSIEKFLILITASYSIVYVLYYVYLYKFSFINSGG